MALTRRSFLKISGFALAATGTGAGLVSLPVDLHDRGGALEYGVPLMCLADGDMVEAISFGERDGMYWHNQRWYIRSGSEIGLMQFTMHEGDSFKRDAVPPPEWQAFDSKPLNISIPGAEVLVVNWRGKTGGAFILSQVVRS